MLLSRIAPFGKRHTKAVSLGLVVVIAQECQFPLSGNRSHALWGAIIYNLLRPARFSQRQPSVPSLLY